MSRYVKALLLIAVALAPSIRGQSTLKAVRLTQADAPRYDDAFPVASYESAEPADPKQKELRRLRGKRYDGWNVINEAAETPGVTIESEIEYPALPVIDSDLILVGEVTEARAFLSNDRGGVYSEFTTRAGEVLKQDAGAPVNSGESLTAERAGGRVKYASGRVGRVRFQGQGMLRRGRKYVLFLKRNAERESFTLLTAYELRDGKVYPVDGAVAAVGNRKWPGDAYVGADESGLFIDLRREIANPTQKRAVY